MSSISAYLNLVLVFFLLCSCNNTGRELNACALEKEKLQLRIKTLQAQVLTLDKERLQWMAERSALVARTSSAERTSRSEQPLAPKAPATKLRCKQQRGQFTVASDAMAPENFTSSARVMPYHEGNQLLGMKIYVTKNGLASSCGLQSGDIMLSVNGHELKEPARALDAYSSVAKTNSARIKLRRDGQDKEIVIRLIKP